QADGERRDAVLGELGERAPRGYRVQSSGDRAVREEPLRDFAAQVARDEGRGRVDEEIVHVVAALAPDLEGITEPFGRQERGPGALLLDQRVGRERRPVDDGPDLTGAHARLVEERMDPLFDAV